MLSLIFIASGKKFWDLISKHYLKKKPTLVKIKIVSMILTNHRRRLSPPAFMVQVCFTTEQVNFFRNCLSRSAFDLGIFHTLGRLRGLEHLTTTNSIPGVADSAVIGTIEESGAAGISNPIGKR